jgi:hypothetical protein
VPTTDALLNSRDRESGRPYTELVRDEEFLGSHILRVSSGNGFGGKEVHNIRENRGKAKSYTTVNGRTVIVKENMVYSNKGTVDLESSVATRLTIQQASRTLRKLNCCQM